MYFSIVNNKYFPDNPRGFLLLPKNKYVARTVPLLTFFDESFYYFICKILEDDIAKNRVKNTFGGWMLGTKLKKMEEDDLSIIQYTHNSYNPYLWTENWKKFLQIAKSFVDSRKYKYVIKLDISNFYDSINLNILLSKLYKAVAKEKMWSVDYLSFFLKYWNKGFNNYLPRSQGLPQNEFGDQSRLLANFYLQEYDEIVKNTCDEHFIEYVRYADDQLLFLSSDNYENVLLVVNKELNKLGLNLNSSKCRLMSIDDFSEYHLLKPLSLLDEKRNDDSLTLFLNIYNKNKNIRYDTYFKRILGTSVGLSSFNKNLLDRAIDAIVFGTDFVLYCNAKQLKAIYEYLDCIMKQKFIDLLKQMAKEVKFNYVEITINAFLESIKNAN